MSYSFTLFIYLPLIVITAITPYITRKTESFGITIPSELYQDETLIQFRKTYARMTTIFGLVLAGLLAVLINTVSEEVWFISFTISIFVS